MSKILKEIDLFKGKSKNVTYDSEGTKSIAQELLAIFDEYSGRIQGISAPQLGYRSRVILCRIHKKPVIMLNPEIIKSSTILRVSTEGCESVKGRYDVKRPLWVQIQYLALDGSMKKRVFGWKTSRIIMHEIDHLEGKTIRNVGVYSRLNGAVYEKSARYFTKKRGVQTPN